MQPQVRISLGGIVGDADVPDDHGIDVEFCRKVDSVTPKIKLPGWWKCIDRQQKLRLATMGIGE